MEHKNPGLDTIILDEVPETITVEDSSPEKRKKTKRRHKRKNELGINRYKGMEMLLITQKVRVKRKKESRTIHINTVCKERKRRSSSIVRYDRNEFINRIVPICWRKKCFDENINSKSKSGCCRSDGNNDCFKVMASRKMNRTFSPVSSKPESFENNISYEEVSNGNFSDSSSEDELETLIKRTKEREKQSIDRLNYSARLFTSSPVHEDVDARSLASTHSKATLVLTPEIDAYSPTTSPNYVQDIIPYSPTMYQEFVKVENCEEHTDTPYSPTDLIGSPCRFHFNEIANRIKPEKEKFIMPRSPCVKFETGENKYHVSGLGDKIKSEVKTETEMIRSTNCVMKTETIEKEYDSEMMSDVNSNFTAHVKVENF